MASPPPAAPDGSVDGSGCDDSPRSSPPQLNLSNRLNPNNVYYDAKLAANYKRMNKVERDELWALDALMRDINLLAVSQQGSCPQATAGISSTTSSTCPDLGLGDSSSSSHFATSSSISGSQLPAFPTVIFPTSLDQEVAAAQPHTSMAAGGAAGGTQPGTWSLGSPTAVFSAVSSSRPAGGLAAGHMMLAPQQQQQALPLQQQLLLALQADCSAGLASSCPQPPREMLQHWALVTRHLTGLLPPGLLPHVVTDLAAQVLGHSTPPNTTRLAAGIGSMVMGRSAAASIPAHCGASSNPARSSLGTSSPHTASPQQLQLQQHLAWQDAPYPVGGSATLSSLSGPAALPGLTQPGPALYQLPQQQASRLQPHQAQLQQAVDALSAAAGADAGVGASAPLQLLMPATAGAAGAAGAWALPQQQAGGMQPHASAMQHQQAAAMQQHAGGMLLPPCQSGAGNVQLAGLAQTAGQQGQLSAQQLMWLPRAQPQLSALQQPQLGPSLQELLLRLQQQQQPQYVAASMGMQ